MAESFEGPVTVTQSNGERETVVGAGSVRVGLTLSSTPRKPKAAGFPGIAAIVSRVGSIGADSLVTTVDEAVAVDDAHAPAVPDVFMEVGDRGASGGITVRNQDDRAAISLNGENGFGTFGTADGASGGIMLRSGKNGPVILMTGKDGRITFFDAGIRTTLVIDGVRGDIELVGADCAEDFDVAEPAGTGSVLCLDDDSRLRPCREPYDRRVVGVVSGAGEWRPGLRLGRRSDDGATVPLALVGRVYCMADASPAPIGVGDLLTTSSTAGHAMRASDPNRAFGAVLGKSLGSLHRGRGLVPVLVALQ